MRRRTRGEYRLRELVAHRFMEHLEAEVLQKGELSAIVDRIASREIDAYTAATDILARTLKSANASVPSPDHPITRSLDS